MDQTLTLPLFIKASPKVLPCLLVLFLALQGCSKHESGQKGTQHRLMSEQEAMEVLEKFHQDTTTRTLSGAQLAQVYCGVCHLFPQPPLLDKSTWTTQVLPNMGKRLGMEMPAHGAGMGNPLPPALSTGNSGTQRLLISEQNWEKIVAYYEGLAPDTPLPQEHKASVDTLLPLFRVRKPAPNHQMPPLTSLLRYNPQDRLLYLGNRQGRLYTINGKTLATKDSLPTPSPPADILFTKGGATLLLSMGVMDPSDAALGRLDSISMAEEQPQSPPLLNYLFRPVQFAQADLDLDGRQDLVVCEFGFRHGRLSWHQNLPSGYKQHLINSLPGARRVLVQDLDQDGRQDLVVLMTQAQEGVYAYYNRKEGFLEKPLLRFPPVWGASDFSMLDFDGDGDLDILCTFGDNADYSYSLKPYHGIRLYLNKGQHAYQESWFYPMHGATRAIAEDYDQDGDLDIAAIAFFPDFEGAPQESFVYFENKGNFRFSPKTFEATPSGRWLTIEAADVDQDGDTDLMLGSFILGPMQGAEQLLQQWKATGLPYLILENLHNTHSNIQAESRSGRKKQTN